MKVLSLFDGISCGMVALERAGIKVDKYVAYEIDENAIKVSKTNYPQIEHKGNVFEADYSNMSFDLLIGGSPCTYWSIAKASSGERETTASGLGFELFMEYVRALKETKPKYFLYENNASMSKEIKNAITNELCVEPIMIDSADFSAQTRKRLYWTNIKVDKYTPKDLRIKDIVYDNNYKNKNCDKYLHTIKKLKNRDAIKWDSSGKGYYSQQNVARGFNEKMNTLTARGVDKCNIWLGGTKYRWIHPVEAERLQTLPDGYTDILSDSQRIKVLGNGWTVDVIAHILRKVGK